MLLLCLIILGNLGTNVTEKDLVNLFGLSATPYLNKACTVELATCEKTGKSKNFAFINVPEHVHNELMKLNGIEFYGRQLVIEEAKTKPDEESKNDEDKENRVKRKPNYNNNRNGRRPGGYNNYSRRGGGNNRFNNRPRNKYNIPSLEPDQVFHLIDGGCNLTHGKYVLFILYYTLHRVII